MIHEREKAGRCWKPVLVSLKLIRKIHRNSPGSYVYAEASKPRKGGDRAVLLSPLLRGLYCLRLHFHMLGTNIGSLNAYKLSGSRKTAVFSISGNKGDQWYEVHASLTGDETFKVN